MIELNKKAGIYAEENVINILKEVIAKVYADGYRDGYKDREEEIPLDFRDNKTEYVDLGLPSGTLWSRDYEMINGKVVFMPYLKASQLCIPTESQWQELKDNCQWQYPSRNRDRFDCIGPNGNSISFALTGYETIKGELHYTQFSDFWILDSDNEHNKMAVEMRGDVYMHILHYFMGYRLPVRQIRNM